MAVGSNMLALAFSLHAGLLMVAFRPLLLAGTKHSTKNIGEGEARWLYGYA